MKKIVRISLLFFWLAAIFAPSVVTLMDWDNNIIVSTLGEEEQKEQEKKDPTEEKIIHDNFSDFSLIALSNKSRTGDFNSTNYSDYMAEILLPPPEYTI